MDSKVSQALGQIYTAVGLPVAPPLFVWERWVGAWADDYCRQHGAAGISEIVLGSAVFLFDHVAERVVLAYAVSTPQLHPRDRVRMRGFPDVNVGVRSVLGPRAFMADRGHFLGHASGGALDINLFPHRRELNRGWGEGGKRFRRMERFVGTQHGLFFFHRPVYDDATWMPAYLEYGIFTDRNEWWRDRFENKLHGAAS